ncbi:hypothetical protein MmTuc01_0697 [Methanosarcina mazei Tuc01]|uniref:Uncharacterized protein n=1 Tax=Methanosarcina mazei Tuc01 TaxID=1236903 RepID=M1QGI5_METMZ|nr:hypothetical protein MmTuc01_0697 [Methanosarcina mazei Tuc01]
MESSPLFTGFIINVLYDTYSCTQPASFSLISAINGELTCEGSIVPRSHFTLTGMGFLF